MRKVFFSFHYANDVNRAMVVRNSWVLQGTESAGFLDRAGFEAVKRQGNEAVYRWINSQLDGTSVTVVLIGSETLNRHFVCYEICESIKRRNAIIGVRIHGIKDMITQRVSAPGDAHTIIGTLPYGSEVLPLYFDSPYVCTSIYDYVQDNGYKNLGAWIEAAANKN